MELFRTLLLQFIFLLQNDKKRGKGIKKQKRGRRKDTPLTKTEKNVVSVLSRIIRDTNTVERALRGDPQFIFSVQLITQGVP